MENNYINLVLDDGREIKAEILFTFNSPEYNKDYIVFIPENLDVCVAASYIQSEDGFQLSLIDNEEEWQTIQEIVDDLMKQSSSCGGHCGGCGCDCGEECDGDCCGEECSCEKDCD